MRYLKGNSSLMIYEKFDNLKFKYGDRKFLYRQCYVNIVRKNKKNNRINKKLIRRR